MQTMRLVQLGTASTGHALDLGKASVHGVTLVLDLRGVESAADHQAVSLAVEIFQTVLSEYKETHEQLEY